MNYTKLDAANACLRVLGELRVNSLDDTHPALVDIIENIESETTRLCADRWWFNTEYPTLVPQIDSNVILVPNDVLTVDSLTKYPFLAVRGNRLYNLTEGTDQFLLPLQVRIQRRVAFDDLPVTARFYVALTAKYHFQDSMDGDGSVTRKLSQDRAEAYGRMNAENIRAEQANMLHRPGVRRILNRMYGDSPFAIRRS